MQFILFHKYSQYIASLPILKYTRKKVKQNFTSTLKWSSQAKPLIENRQKFPDRYRLQLI